MATPTTLLEFRTNEAARADAWKNAATQELAGLQADVTAATVAATRLTTKLTVLDADERVQRDALATTTVQADGEAILAKLQSIAAQRRALGYEIATTGATIATKTMLIVGAQVRATTAVAAATAATSACDQAEADVDPKKEDSRFCLLDRLGRPPASQVRTRAKSNDVKQAVNDARARIQADIPAALLARATSRGASAVQRQQDAAAKVAAAQSALRSFATTVAPRSGPVAESQAAFDAALANLVDYVANAGPRLTQAIAMLATIAAAPPLSNEAKAAISAADATTSAALEDARDVAQDKLAADQAALDTAVLAATRADPDSVATDNAVQTATTTRDTSKTALDTAETAYTQADRDKLDAWEATVPDTSWKLLADFTAASATVENLKALDPATLGPALDAAETALAAALDDQGKGARSAAQLAALAGTAQAEADVARTTATAELFSALRGDR